MKSRKNFLTRRLYFQGIRLLQATETFHCNQGSSVFAIGNSGMRKPLHRRHTTPLIFSQPGNFSTASWSFPFARCPYLSVIVAFEWPTIIPTTYMSIPASITRVTNVWRRSWKWQALMPARRHAFSWELITLMQ